MKRTALIVGILLAVLCTGIVSDASAQRGGFRYGYGYRCRPHRVWIAPPPPVVVVGPRYGYHRPYFYHRPYYNRGAHYYGYNHRPYGRGRW